MATTDYQVRIALKLLSRHDRVDRADFSLQHVGDMTIDVLLENGWAETSSSLSGRTLYSITDAGRARAAEPVPEKPPKGIP